ncbi:MAG: helix-turn-helix domain-containing protein, partial [Bacteroidales bacterium]|nr:helix-turn-helix domain-containing protein [Bacteroidales bacterium]
TLKQVLPHLIPFGIYLLAITPLITMPVEEKRDIITNGFPYWLTVVFSINDIVISVQGVIYSALSLRLLQRVKYFRIKQLSKEQLRALNWLVFFVLANIFFWIIGTSGAILELFNPNIQFDLFRVFYLGIAFLNILMGIYTIYKPKLFSFDESLRTLVYDTTMSHQSELIDNETDKNKEDLCKIEDYIKSEKIYLQKKIDLPKLLYTTGVSKRRLYEVLDLELNMSLTDLLNRYRTDEMITMLDSNMQQDYTLTHLAEMAGFQSKATFNRVFKKYTGKTPSEFIAHQN